jgi:hypothetical protein
MHLSFKHRRDLDSTLALGFDLYMLHLNESGAQHSIISVLNGLGEIKVVKRDMRLYACNTHACSKVGDQRTCLSRYCMSRLQQRGKAQNV